MVTNKEVADKLYQIADLLEIRDVRFEPVAYRRAARSVEDESQDLSELYKLGGVDALRKIDGIGQGISSNIEYMLTHRGKSDKLNGLLKDISKGVLDMLKIPGMGPKKVKRLYSELKIDSLVKLKRAAKLGKIRELSGFGEKSETDILTNINRQKKKFNRVPYAEALPIANKFLNELKKSKFVKKIGYMGSLRRKRPTVGDIDILIASDKPKIVMKKFTSIKGVTRILVQGDTKSSILFDGTLQIDLRIVPEKSYGSAAQYFTGSMEHNVLLRRIAIKKGFKLSEWGLFNRETDEQIETKTEGSVYRKLGFKLIPPERRIGGNEFRAFSLEKN